ncbi:HEAT repeat domain-containing protein [Paenibacillus wenxiniae]|uniref:HEAT repeat domain-containing protein n=1 Tax=Paenibacillus wenxiniae TaxID=1636843 RepID=A0ABW4RGD6_9BACL
MNQNQNQIRLCTRRQWTAQHIVDRLSSEESLSIVPVHDQQKGQEVDEYYSFVMNDGLTMIYVVVDRATSLPYIVLHGPLSAQSAWLLNMLRVTEDIGTIQQYCREAEHAEDKIDAICRLGIAAYFDEAQPEIVDTFKQYMRDGDARVRQSAIFATSFIGWPEFEPLLQIAMERDPDTRVSAIAESAIRIMRESDWGDTPSSQTRS